MALFAHQAIPTGGLSGSLLVACVVETDPIFHRHNRLVLRRPLSDGGACLRHATWEWLSIMFAAIVILITLCLVAVTFTKVHWIPRSLLRRPLMARPAKALAQVRTDIATDPKVLGPTIFHLAIFVLDATTLWFAVRAQASL